MTSLTGRPIVAKPDPEEAVVEGGRQKRCLGCGQVLAPKLWSNGIREGTTQFERRKCCSPQCAAAMRIRRTKNRTEKRCPRCKQVKAVAEFRIHRDRTDGRHVYCRPCENEREAEYRKTNPKGIALARRIHLRFHYNLSPAEYDAMVIAQRGLCAICGRAEQVLGNEGNPKPLGVDHDHATGAIRGLLCQRCNQGLGNFGDDPQRLVAAAAYLTRGQQQ